MVTVSEAQRRALHDGLVKKLGVDVADTLMDYLPPAGWSDLARRSDLDQLRTEMQAMESRLDVKLADVRTEIAELRVWTSDKITGQTRWLMASQLVLVVATIGSITTIAH
jgi:hypothetical protein